MKEQEILSCCALVAGGVLQLGREKERCLSHRIQFNGGTLIQFHLGVLESYSYLLCSCSGAMLIDPGRDLEKYEEYLCDNHLDLCGVFLTHIHDDQVCGHTEAGARYHVPIYISGRAGAEFPHIDLTDDDLFHFGRLKLHFFDTPGHTDDSMCMTAGIDPAAPEMLFSGDALTHTETEPAWKQCFDQFPDDLRIYPAHEVRYHAGTWATLAEEKNKNPLFNRRRRPRRAEHHENGSCREINRKGPEKLDPEAVYEKVPPQRITEHSRVIDIRCPARYAFAHIPGSLNIDANGKLEKWTAGMFRSLQHPLTLIADSENALRSAAKRLIRIGYDIRGAVFRNYQDQELPVAHVKLINPPLLKMMQEHAPFILDVRARNDYGKGHIPGAENIPLAELSNHLDQLPEKRKIVLVCGTGFLSGIACGLLEQGGISDFFCLNGGTANWLENGNRITRSA